MMDDPMLIDNRRNEAAFEDLTLAEAVGRLRRAPRETLNALLTVAQTPTSAPRSSIGLTERTLAAGRAAAFDDAAMEPHAAEDTDAPRLAIPVTMARVGAWGLAVIGGVTVGGLNGESASLLTALPLWIVAMIVWIGAEIADRRLNPAAIEREARAIPQAFHLMPNLEFALRTTLGIAAIVLSFIAWEYNRGNFFTVPGVLGWIVSIGLWIWVVAPAGWHPLMGVRAAARWVSGTPRLDWTMLALLVIVILGAVARLDDLRTLPPEMTSDHVEKLRDAFSITQGATNVFFANNGGREPIQFYGLAALSDLTGLEFDFYLLKLLTAIEGILSIPVMYAFGRVMIGRDQAELGKRVGLILAAMVAVGFWHLMLSRLGLRIVLTPLLTAITLIFLARGMREGRRWDFIWVGLMLGIGLYAYQALRMIPVVVVIGVALAIIGASTRRARGELLTNLGVAAVIAFAVFVPMLRFAAEYPDDFWRRTSGRLFGDAITQEVDANGNLIARAATPQERLTALAGNVPILGSNLIGAVGMFNVRGDIAWLHNLSFRPALDVLVGGWLIVGVAAWGVRMVTRRGAVDALMPIALLVMLLPSALSIAYPIENPSFTRASGALSFVFLFAAYPLAIVAGGVERIARGRVGAALAAITVIAVVGLSYTINRRVLDDDYRDLYLQGSLPYTDAGEILRGFALSYGGYGNAFVIAYPYWWDHRALGLEAGAPDYPNGVPHLNQLAAFLESGLTRTDRYRLDADKPLIFFYHPEDLLTEGVLRTVFPQGTVEVLTTYQPENPYRLYRASAVGAAGLVTAIDGLRTLNTPAQ